MNKRKVIPLRSAELPETPLARDIVDAVKYYLGGRRGFLVLSGLAVVTGIAFNWNWLVAVGIAPILIAALPCVAMCALGLCMNKMGGKSCAADPDSVRDGDRETRNLKRSNIEAAPSKPEKGDKKDA